MLKTLFLTIFFTSFLSNSRLIIAFKVQIAFAIGNDDVNLSITSRLFLFVIDHLNPFVKIVKRTRYVIWIHYYNCLKTDLRIFEHLHEIFSTVSCLVPDVQKYSFIVDENLSFFIIYAVFYVISHRGGRRKLLFANSLHQRIFSYTFVAQKKNVNSVLNWWGKLLRLFQNWWSSGIFRVAKSTATKEVENLTEGAHRSS